VQVAKLAGALELSLEESAIQKDRIRELEVDKAALEADNAELYGKAYTDRLTGVANRNSLEEKLPELVEIAKNNGEPLVCVIVDSDGLKRVNLEHGFRSGDRLLQSIAAALDQIGTSVDLIARLGGDEFCLVIPGFKAYPGHTQAELMEEIIQIINRVIEGNVSELGLSEEIHAGASVGFSQLNLEDDNASELLARADIALRENQSARKEALKSQGVVFDKEDDRLINPAKGY